ncbi:hypothetical protein MASR1M65_10410 [Saprospiraceae bacterium]|nr:PorP/SprF family type IX secretion system membrane protein [Saprospiraceae bacterium]
MKYRYLLFITILFSFKGEIFCQDPRFSQFYTTPQLINPALTGVFDGEYRINVNYRNQWNSILNKSAFTSYAAGGEYRYNVADEDYVGGGLQFLKQNSGVGDLSRLQTHLNASYIKQLGSNYRGPDYYLAAGLQLGFGQLSTNWNKYWFSRQYDPNSQSVNTNINSGESGADRSGLFLDLGAGLLWYAVFDERTSIYVGGSLGHLNKPDIALYDDSKESMYNKFTAHAGGEFLITPYFSLLPAAYFITQGPTRELVAGSNIRYSNGDWREFSIRAGGFARINNRLNSFNNFESTVVNLSFEFDRWMMGLSYDINFSDLQAVTNSRGAFELSLTYIARERARYRVKCPTF